MSALCECVAGCPCPQQSQVNTGDRAVEAVPVCLWAQRTKTYLALPSWVTAQQQNGPLFAFIMTWGRITLRKNEKSVECLDLPFVCSWQKISGGGGKHCHRISWVFTLSKSNTQRRSTCFNAEMTKKITLATLWTWFIHNIYSSEHNCLSTWTLGTCVFIEGAPVALLGSHL